MITDTLHNFLVAAPSRQQLLQIDLEEVPHGNTFPTYLLRTLSNKGISKISADTIANSHVAFLLRKKSFQRLERFYLANTGVKTAL